MAPSLASVQATVLAPRQRDRISQTRARRPLSDGYHYTDVYWFAPGYSFDSPYGDWVSGGAKPQVDMCNLDKYYIDQARSYNDNGNYTVQTFVSLSVNPLINHPTNKNISINGTIFTCDPPLSNMSQYCVATGVGDAIVNFNFGGTYGHFYGDYKVLYDSRPELNESCPSPDKYMRAFSGQFFRGLGAEHYWDASAGRGRYSGGSLSNYVLQVPAQTISCPITVADNTAPPEKPTVSSGACTVGTALTITFASTDPNGHQLKYGVDWDADGSVDQWVPSSAANRQIPFLRRAEIVTGRNRLYNICHSACPAQRAGTRSLDL